MMLCAVQHTVTWSRQENVCLEFHTEVYSAELQTKLSLKIGISTALSPNTNDVSDSVTAVRATV
jgi:hypothetical protein